MKKQKKYNRSNLKKYAPTSTYVSSDGLYVERDYKNKGKLKTYCPQIYQDKSTGLNFLDLRRHGVIRIDLMVLTCYCSPKPMDGKEYLINHKDGDTTNDDFTNLEWIENSPTNKTKIEADFAEAPKNIVKNKYKSLGISVNSNGEISQNGQPLSPFDELYDSDVNWNYHLGSMRVAYYYTDRWGNGRYEKVDVEKVLDDFGYIQGDKNQFSNSVVLHKDNDYVNCDPSNLEWCDKSDPRYVAFHKATLKKTMDKELKDNSGHAIPPLWKDVYKDVLPDPNIKFAP